MGINNKLNLGCGEFEKEGYINIDHYYVSEPELKESVLGGTYCFLGNNLRRIIDFLLIFILFFVQGYGIIWLVDLKRLNLSLW